MAAQCTPRKPTRMARSARNSCCPAPTTNTAPTALAPSTTAKRCQRPGPMQRNPYLNFLREYRKKCCGLSPVETIRQGAKAWKSLSKEERQRFIVEAFYTRKRPRNNETMSRARHRNRSRRQRSVAKRRRSGRSGRVRSRKMHKARMC